MKNFTYCTLITILLSVSNYVLGCSCRDVTISGSTEWADAIFKGSVLDSYITREFDSLGVSVANLYNTDAFQYFVIRAVIIKVDTVFKGEYSDTITVITPMNGAACGVSFKKGKEYIVFAKKWSKLKLGPCELTSNSTTDMYWTHLCTSTSIWFPDSYQQLLDALSNSYDK